jgi:hypothetical protein
MNSSLISLGSIRGTNGGFTPLCCVGQNTIFRFMVSRQSDKVQPRHGLTSRFPLYEVAAQIMQQREMMKRTPQIPSGYLPNSGCNSPNNNNSQLASFSVSTFWSYLGDSSLARLSKEYASAVYNSVVFGTVAAHRVSCPRTRGEKFRSGCHAPLGMPNKAGSIGNAGSDGSNPRHLGTSSARTRRKVNFFDLTFCKGDANEFA